MKICIHRGTKEIGGTCIEVESQGKRIVLDIGMPLDALDDEQSLESLVPKVSGFKEHDHNLLGVLISHMHMDHYGLGHKISQDIPVWIGQSAHRMMEAAIPFIRNGFAFKNPNFLENNQLIKIGPFSITPYLTDHSAFDAYALLIEADGKRVFYSGDFRGHGRKSSLFDKLVVNPPSNIDVLLMEGTTIGRVGTMEGFKTENDLENDFSKAFRETDGLHLVWTSSQNIDRLVTIYKAAKKTKRLFIIDLYTAEILKATGRNTIPQSFWSDVRLYITSRQRKQIIDKKLFSILDQHKSNRIFHENLPKLAKNSVMLFRPMFMGDKGLENSLDGATLSYSMWDGYLEKDSSRKVLEWLEKNQITLKRIHTSGHASVAHLMRFAKAMNPKRLVPIHTFEPEKYSEHFHNVECHQDGEWWDIK